MTDKTITTEDWVALTQKCFELLGDPPPPRDNHILVSSRLYEKLVKSDKLRPELFKTGKWREND